MNTLIRSAQVLLKKDGIYSVEKCDIAIENDTIRFVGDVPEDFITDSVVNGEGKFAVPSLINCHTHAYMSVFRNLADDLPFDKWLFESIMPREDRMTYEGAKAGAMLSLIEMMKIKNKKG